MEGLEEMEGVDLDAANSVILSQSDPEGANSYQTVTIVPSQVN